MIPHDLIQGGSLRFPDHGITWAGECPWTGGFCFGTENGELLICRNVGVDQLGVDPIKVSEEAVNGVAFWRDYVGVSTRSELIVGRRGPAEEDLRTIIRAAGGAHGILATPEGRFFAPMGVAGLLRIDLDQLPRGGVNIEVPNQTIINFYKLTSLGDASRQDLLACAARTSGLLTIQTAGDGEPPIVGLVSPSIDFIDVCSVSSARWPQAIVGLSLDRSLIFVRDLLAEETPQTLRLGQLRGTPYSILSADDRLFVLTSKELVAFHDLVPWYRDGEARDRPFRYRYTPIQAVDAYIAYGKRLMVVMDEEVRFFDIPRLAEPVDEDIRGNGQGDVSGWSEGEQLPAIDQPTWNSFPLSVS
jgi:hypothetical protein